VVELQLPELVVRGRKEIEKLIRHFCQFKKKQFRRLAVIIFDKETMDYLATYHWPGNVRDLENVIENLYVLDKETITLADIPDRIRRNKLQQSLLLADVERAHVKKVLTLFDGNLSQAAKALGIALNTLKSKLG
jgi:DNA-binding NtrC family response regulator